MSRLDDGAMRLRSGRSVWQASEADTDDFSAIAPRGMRELETDIVIVGAGITGAFLAERFTRSGRRVLVIDRREPAKGSTTASTSMLLWELDASLLELEDRLGLERAGDIARRCRRQVSEIGALAGRLGIDCGFRARSSLYLAGDGLDATDLREERRIREMLGINGAFLDEGDLAAMGIMGEGALLYPGSADADPVRLARGLLAAAGRRGALALSPATAESYETTANGVTIQTREGDLVRARVLVLANGYEMPDFVPATRHKLVTSWALASPAAQGFLRSDAPLLWEAADPYLYMRSTVDGRVIIGGEDEDFSDADIRERMTPQKIEALLAKSAARCPALAGITPEFAWSGVFGETHDSLPMIGRVPGHPNCLAAFGYGGNGITFSALAARLLEDELEGRADPDVALYALDRD